MTKGIVEVSHQIKKGSLIAVGATVAGFSKMKVAMDKDPNLIKVKNETIKGMQVAGSFFKTIFGGKIV